MKLLIKKEHPCFIFVRSVITHGIGGEQISGKIPKVVTFGAKQLEQEIFLVEKIDKYEVQERLKVTDGRAVIR